MAGHNQRDRVGPAGPADSPRGLGLIELIGEIAIGLHRAAGNGQQQIPNRLPKCRAGGEIQRRQYAWGFALQHRVQCRGGLVQPLGGRIDGVRQRVRLGPGKLKPCQTGLGKLRTKRSQLGFNKGGVHVKKLSRRHWGPKPNPFTTAE